MARCAECGRDAVLPVPFGFGVRCRLCHEKMSDREIREDMRRKSLKRGRNWIGIVDKSKHGAMPEVHWKRRKG